MRYRWPILVRTEVWRRVYLVLVGFSVAMTLASRSSGLSIRSMGCVMSTAILVVACWALALSLSDAVGPRRALLTSCALLAFGAAVEIVGVGTGWPFGRYEYTSNWAPVVWVPGVGRFAAAVPLAWFAMAGASAVACARLGRWSIPAAGALAAAVDLVIESAMTDRMGYWTWIDRGPLPGGAPWTNALGWFASASIGAAIVVFGLGSRRAEVSTALWILGGQVAVSLALWPVGSTRG